MTNLDYLKNQIPKNGSINLDSLLSIKSERNAWLDLKINEPFKKFLTENNIQFKSEYQRFDQPEVTIGTEDEINTNDRQWVLNQIKNLMPWKKGPFNLFGEEIDAEWRSDFKWDRISKGLNLKEQIENKTILDIGCNNGYFMFRMLEHNPKMVLGIDPVVRNLAQFYLMQYFAHSPQLHFELFGVEHLEYFKNYFDTIFSMGILYHHRSPLEQIMQMRDALKPGGSLILETIIFPGDDAVAFTPLERYAKMRNVYFLPTKKCLENWLHKCKLTDIQLIEMNATTIEEQRNTKYCPLPQETLIHFLDESDQSKTIEGYPSPIRATMIARKKS